VNDTHKHVEGGFCGFRDVSFDGGEEIGCIVKNKVVLFPEKVVESYIDEMKALGREKAASLKPARPRIVPHATGFSTGNA